MSLSGTLQDFDISNIFLLIEQDSQSGRLIITTGSSKTIIIFKNGMVVNVTTDSEDIKVFVYRFLHLVKGYSQMETKELDALFYNNLHLLSDELVRKGYLTNQELTTIVQTSLVDITCGVFTLDNGHYLFETAPSVDEFQYLNIAVPSNFIMLEAARRNDEWVNIGTVINDETIFGGNINISPSQVHQPLSNFTLYTISFIDGKRTVGEICNMVFFSHFHVYKAMDEALRDGKITLINRPDHAPLPSSVNKTPKRSSSDAVMNNTVVAITSVITVLALVAIIVSGVFLSQTSSSTNNKRLQQSEQRRNDIAKAQRDLSDARLLYMGIKGTLPEITDSLLISEDFTTSKAVKHALSQLE